MGACVFSHALPPAGSLPVIDPSGKGARAMLKPATLVLVGLASAAAIAHAFRAPFPGPGGNPVLDLIAYHDPGFHTVIRVWYYVAPAVAVVLFGSLGLSVWRVWLQPRAGGGRRGSLLGDARRRDWWWVGELIIRRSRSGAERPSCKGLMERERPRRRVAWRAHAEPPRCR